MKPNKDSLGDRMKRYEAVNRAYGIRRVPMIIRIDGKAFHTFARHLDKPYDGVLQSVFVNAALSTIREMQGGVAFYHQSDEVTFLLTDYAKLTTNAWFDYNIQKLTSITASLMTLHFNNWAHEMGLEGAGTALFDARAFSVPREDVANCFLWRMKDWERNSLQMFARTFFSHRDLHGKGRADIHEMLHGIGRNWTVDVAPVYKNGSLFVSNMPDGGGTIYFVSPTHENISYHLNSVIYPDMEEM